MWKTGGGNNNTNWGDPRYDEIISELVLLADPAERMPLMHEQEEILMRDMPDHADLLLHQPHDG